MIKIIIKILVRVRTLCKVVEIDFEFAGAHSEAISTAEHGEVRQGTEEDNRVQRSTAWYGGVRQGPCQKDSYQEFQSGGARDLDFAHLLATILGCPLRRSKKLGPARAKRRNARLSDWTSEMGCQIGVCQSGQSVIWRQSGPIANEYPVYSRLGPQRSNENRGPLSKRKIQE